MMPTMSALLFVVGLAGPPVAASSPRPFDIVDNSFLVEEAFNQEAGVFQNIVTATRSADGRVDFSFTQEWPVGGQTHQFSYTIPFAVATGVHGVGDVLLNYRLQVLGEHGRRPAFAPRVSLILPGVTLADSDVGRGVNLVSRVVAASVVVRLRPMFHALCEAVTARHESLGERATTVRQTALIVSPGFRGGWNIGDRQLVIGVAAPMTLADGSSSTGVLTYFSYELPWSR